RPTATTPVDVFACTCSPATPTKTRSSETPAMSSASFIAARTDSVVSSMSVTTSRRIPPVRACPTPSILILGCRGGSPATSTMTAHVFVVPMSSPAKRLARISATCARVQRDHDLVSESYVDPAHAPHLLAALEVLYRQAELLEALAIQPRREQHLRVRRLAQEEPDRAALPRPDLGYARGERRRVSPEASGNVDQ